MSESTLSLVVVGGGLLAIALTLWFGLHSFKGGITDKLQKISEDLSTIRTKQDALWDVVALRSQPNWSGTVTRAMPNLGKVEISANPKERQTQYFVKAQHGTMSHEIFGVDGRLLQLGRRVWADASHRPQQAADGWEKVFAFYERCLG